MKPEEVTDITENTITVKGRVPVSAHLFQDHFPGFPVLPGVLMLEILVRTAEAFLERQGTGVVRVRQFRQVKYSSFLKPGDPWEARLERTAAEGASSAWNARLTTGGKPVCSAKLGLEQAREPLFFNQEGK